MTAMTAPKGWDRLSTFASKDTLVGCCMASDSSSECVWTVELGGWIRCRRSADGVVLSQTRLPVSVDPTCISLLSAACLLCVGRSDGVISVFRVSPERTLQELCDLNPMEGAGSVTSVSPCPSSLGDSTKVHQPLLLTSTCSHGFMSLWEVPVGSSASAGPTMISVVELRLDGPLNGVVWVGSTCVASHDDSHAIVLFSATPESFSSRPFCRLPGHERDVLSLHWDVQRQLLWSSSQDESVRCWDLSFLRNPRGLEDNVAATCVCVLTHHTSPVHLVTGLPRSNSIATAALDGTIAFWDVQQRPSPAASTDVLSSSPQKMHRSASVECVLVHEVNVRRDVGGRGNTNTSATGSSHFSFCVAEAGARTYDQVWVSVTDGSVVVCGRPCSTSSQRVSDSVRKELDELRQRVPFTEQQLAAFMLEKKAESERLSAFREDMVRLLLDESVARYAIMVSCADSIAMATRSAKTSVETQFYTFRVQHDQTLQQLHVEVDQEIQNLRQSLQIAQGEIETTKALGAMEKEGILRAKEEELDLRRQEAIMITEQEVAACEAKWMQKLEHVNAEMHRTLDGSLNTIQGLNQQMDEACAAELQLRQMLSEATSRVAEKESKIMELETQRDQLIDRIESSETAHQVELADLSREWKHELNASQKLFEDAENGYLIQIQELQSNLNEMTTRCNQSKTELDAERALCRTRIEELMDSIRHDKEVTEDAIATLAAERSSHDAHVSAMESVVNELKAKLDDANRLLSISRIHYTREQQTSAQTADTCGAVLETYRNFLVDIAGSLNDQVTEWEATERRLLERLRGVEEESSECSWRMRSSLVLKKTEGNESEERVYGCSLREWTRRVLSNTAALEERVTSLDAAAQEANAEIARRTSAVNAVSVQYHQAAEERDALQQQWRQLFEVQLPKLLEDERIKQQTFYHDVLERKEQAMSAALSEAKRSDEALRQSNADAARLLKQSMSEIQRNHEAQLSELQSLIEQLTAQMNAATEEASALRLREDKMKHTVAIWESRCIEQQSAIENEHKKDVVLLCSERDQLRERLQRATTALEVLQHSNEELATNLMICRQGNESLSRYAVETESQQAQRLDALSRELAQTTKRCKTLSDEKSDLERSLREVEEREEALKAKLLATRRECSEQTEVERQTAAQKESRLIRTLEEVMEDNRLLTQRLEALLQREHTEHDATAARELETQRILRQKDEALRITSERFEYLQDQATTMQLALEHSNAELHHLRREQELLMEERSRSDALAQRNAQLDQQQRQDQAALFDARRRVADMQQEIQRMSSTLVATDKEMQKLRTTHRDKDELLAILAEEVKKGSRR